MKVKSRKKTRGNKPGAPVPKTGRKNSICEMLRENKALVAIFILALLLRIPFALFATSSLQDGDSGGYISMAGAILSGDIFFKGDTRAIAEYRTPGYPLFLAPFSGFLRLASFAQILLDSVSVLIVFLIAKELTGDKIAQFSSALLYAASPLFISFSFMLLTEALFTFAFLLGLLLALRAKDANNSLFAGIAMGFSLLVRPVALPLPFIIALFIFWKKNDMKLAATFLIASYLFCGLWLARNLVVERELFFSRITDITYACWQGPLFLQQADAGQQWNAMISEYKLDDIDACTQQGKEKINAASGVLTSIIMGNLPAYLVADAKASLFLMSPTTPAYILGAFGIVTPHIGDLIAQSGVSLPAILSAISSNMPYLCLFILFAAYQLAFYGLFILGAMKKEGRALAIACLLVLGYLIIASGLVAMVSGYRYRLPFEMLAVPVAGIGLSSFLGFFRGKA